MKYHPNDFHILARCYNLPFDVDAVGVVVHLFAAVRPEPRRPAGARDCEVIQDGHQQVQ